MEGWLNYILILGTEQNEDSLMIISTCLHNRGLHYLWRPAWKDRQAFEVGHWCFYALLAADNSNGLVDFLIEHRGAANLGFKTFSSVTLFWPAEALGDASGGWPALLWEVRETSAIEKVREKYIQSRWHEKDDFVNEPLYDGTAKVGGPRHERSIRRSHFA